MKKVFLCNIRHHHQHRSVALQRIVPTNVSSSLHLPVVSQDVSLYTELMLSRLQQQQQQLRLTSTTTAFHRLIPPSSTTTTAIRINSGLCSFYSFSTAALQEEQETSPSPVASDKLFPRNCRKDIFDAFCIFDIPYTFDINEDELKIKYRNYMKHLHPDKYHHNNNNNNVNIDQQEYQQLANQVNVAYDILKKPHTRSAHLLELLGHPINESDEAVPLVGINFLMQIMHYREEIDEIVTSSSSSLDADNDNNQKEMALQKLLYENQKRIDDTCQQLTAAFHDNNIVYAIQLTAQLQYWNRIYETIRQHMEN